MEGAGPGVETLLLTGPDVEDVVIASTGEILPVTAPGQPAHLLTVGSGGGHHVVRHPGVALLDVPGPAAPRHQPLVPGEARHPGVQSLQAPHHLALLHVPQLDVAGVGTQSEVAALLLPLDAGHVVVLQLADLVDLLPVRVPQVDLGPQRHCQVVVAAPVNQVEIIQDARSIHFSLWSLRDVASNLLPRAVENLHRRPGGIVLMEENLVGQFSAKVLLDTFLVFFICQTLQFSGSGGCVRLLKTTRTSVHVMVTRVFQVFHDPNGLTYL